MENLKDILEWYILSGVDETTGMSPFGLEDVNVIKPRVATSELASTSVDAITQAQKICLSSQNLDELFTHMQKFEGCALKFTCSHTIFGSGNPKAKTMVIIDAPSADDERSGKILSAKNGDLTDSILKAMQIDKSDCYFATLLPWRPPGNRAPTSTEVSICLPFLKKQIDFINPQKIIIFGADVLQAILGTSETLAKLREQKLEYLNSQANKSVIIPSFALNNLLMNPAQKAKLWENIIKCD